MGGGQVVTILTSPVSSRAHHAPLRAHTGGRPQTHTPIPMPMPMPMLRRAMCRVPCRVPCAMPCAVCCAVPCCAVLRCAVLCCAVLCCAVLCCDSAVIVLCCAVIVLCRFNTALRCAASFRHCCAVFGAHTQGVGVYGHDAAERGGGGECPATHSFIIAITILLSIVYLLMH
jgi:hypothetical protein